MTVHALGPLYPGDPERLGGFRVLRRLSAAGQGVVHVSAFMARTRANRYSSPEE